MVKPVRIIQLAGIIIFFLLIPVTLFPEGADSLIDAYKREVFQLDNEIAVLKRRLEEVKTEGTERIQEASSAVDQLEETLSQIRKENTRLQGELDNLQSTGNSEANLAVAAATVYSQAFERLEETGQGEGLGLHLPEGSFPFREMSEIFDRTFRALSTFGSIYQEEGSFYLDNGKEIDGTLIHLGRIALYGISGDTGGSLAPSGDNSFLLVNKDSLKEATELSIDRSPELLPVFLFDSSGEGSAILRKKDFRQTLRDGGIIGGIILIIGLLNIVLIILRIISLMRMEQKGDREILEQITASVEKGSIEEALSLANRSESAFGRIFRSALKSLRNEQEGEDDLIAESILKEQPELERYRQAIMVFASVAPLLGLLGTVTGIISTFDVITIFGSGDPKLLSGGISEALITTEFGLAVAIPLLLIGNILTSWSERILTRMETSALRIVNACQKSNSGINGQGE